MEPFGGVETHKAVIVEVLFMKSVLFIGARLLWQQYRYININSTPSFERFLCDYEISVGCANYKAFA